MEKSNNMEYMTPKVKVVMVNCKHSILRASTIEPKNTGTTETIGENNLG